MTPGPAAATQTIEVDSGPVAAESDAQRGAQEAQARLKEAEEKHAAAEAVVEACRAAVQVLEGSIREASAEIARLDGLHETTAALALTEANLRRRVRTLEGELAKARTAASEASEESGKAADAVDQAHHQVLIAEVDALDEAYLRDIQETEARLKDQRAKVFAKLHEIEAHRPGGNFLRGRISALASPYEPEFVAAHWAVECLAAKTRQQADQKRLERN